MKILALILLAALPVLSQESAKHKIGRRILAAAACSTSAYDAYQTATAIGQGGIYEMNPIGFNKKMIAVKAAGCLAPIVIGEIGAKRSNAKLTNIALIYDAAQTALFVFVIAHNQHVIDSIRQPGQLASR